jgi:hypothetical protein
MSASIHDIAPGVVEIVAEEKLTRADYLRLIPEIEQRIKEHGKVRILVETHHFAGWTLGGVFEDMRFDFKHAKHVDRLAMVGERIWEEGQGAFPHPFTAAQVQYFPPGYADEARAWLCAEAVAAPVK